MKAKLLALTGLVLCVAGWCDSVASQDAPAFQPKYWKDVPDQAEVLAATYIGGKGHEWLISGGFQADGTIVLVGNVLGPVFELPVEVKVLGTDLPAPAEPKPVPQRDAKGGQRTDKQGKPLWEKPSWRHEGTTGFIVRCSGDLKKALSAQRLPWTSGAITSATIGKDNAIYIAGRATDGIAKLGGNIEELAVSPEANRKDGRCDHTFIARLSADASNVEWVRHLKGPSDAPQLTVTDDGSIRLGAQDVRTFDPSGKLLATVIVPGGVKKTSSVSPTDGSIVNGGEHHWPTGREPWRCPTLNVHQSDGKLKYQLYDWGGPYVGLDNCRQVSDTAIRWVTHEPDGSILVYAWSDGGNSVITTQPADVRRGVGHKGLGITAAGAGVLSCAYVVRIEPKNYTVTAWTIWLAFSQTGKPNSIWIDNLSRMPDGSIAIAGRSALGLWQTKNKLTEAEPSGPYVAVFNPQLTGVRFCSVVPGAGVAEVGYDHAAWGIVSGQVNGKTRMLFVGSAVQEADSAATPTRNALQENFGGGWCDGYAILLDLPAAPESVGPPAPVSERVLSAQPSSASFEKGAPANGGKNAPRFPAEDAVFHFKPEYPRYITVDAEIRDRFGKTWPSFLYGKPVEGTLTYQSKQVSADFAVACTSVCQPHGDQARRVLGELFKDNAPPPFRFTLKSLGEAKSADYKTIDKAGKDATRTVEYREGKGVLELAGKKIEVTPKVTCRFSGPKDSAGDKVHVTAWLTLKAGELGLRTPGEDTEIDLRISMTGTSQTQAPPKAK
jgi:hypothetical protein